MNRPLAAVILAAGLSSRMGAFKPLLPILGRSALAWCARAFREAGVEDIAVVVGHRAGEVLAEADRLGLRGVWNPAFTGGMFTSVQAGLAAVSPGAQGVFLLPVDIPLVRPATIARLGQAFAGDVAVHPVFAGQRGHPPLLPRAFFAPILAAGPDVGLRRVLDELEARHGALELPVADEAIVHDHDLPEDFRQTCRRAARLGRPTSGETRALLAMHAVGPRGLAHARAVADVALALARAVNDAGHAPPLDLELTENAALLHDLAKGGAHHEAEGARLLEAAGLPDAARIVAAHRDLDLAPDAPVTERELVYLADKYCSGDRLIEVAARFQEKLDLYAGDPKALAAIAGRMARALALRERLEAEIGRPLRDVLTGAGLPAPAPTGLTPAECTQACRPAKAGPNTEGAP